MEKLSLLFASLSLFTQQFYNRLVELSPAANEFAVRQKSLEDKIKEIDERYQKLVQHPTTTDPRYFDDEKAELETEKIVLDHDLKYLERDKDNYSNNPAYHAYKTALQRHTQEIADKIATLDKLYQEASNDSAELRSLEKLLGMKREQFEQFKNDPSRKNDLANLQKEIQDFYTNHIKRANLETAYPKNKAQYARVAALAEKLYNDTIAT